MKLLVGRYKLGLVDAALVKKDYSVFNKFYPFIIIPYFNSNNEFVWFNARNLDPLSENRYMNGGGSKFLYNMQCESSIMETGNVLIVEGEIDTLSVIRATKQNFPVVGISGSGFKSENIQSWFLRMSERGIKIFTLMDPDEGGRKHEKSIEEIVGKDNLYFRHLYTENGERYQDDINAALQQYGKTTLRSMILKSLER
jgi:5S rRNA maturation endonuclease (ribonuclease M5)